MHSVNAVWHILCLCKAVFIASQMITLCFSSISITACALEINLKFSADFGRFDLSRAVVRMLDD